MSKHSMLLILTSSLCLITLVLMSFFWFLRTRFITTTTSSASVLFILVLRLLTLLVFSGMKSSVKVSPASYRVFLTLVYTRVFLELLNSLLRCQLFFCEDRRFSHSPFISAALSRSSLRVFSAYSPRTVSI